MVGTVSPMSKANELVGYWVMAPVVDGIGRGSLGLLSGCRGILQERREIDG